MLLAHKGTSQSIWICERRKSLQCQITLLQAHFAVPSSPVPAESKEDLPLPVAPTTAMRSPWETERSRSFRVASDSSSYEKLPANLSALPPASMLSNLKIHSFYLSWHEISCIGWQGRANTNHCEKGNPLSKSWYATIPLVAGSCSLSRSCWLAASSSSRRLSATLAFTNWVTSCGNWKSGIRKTCDAVILRDWKVCLRVWFDPMTLTLWLCKPQLIKRAYKYPYSKIKTTACLQNSNICQQAISALSDPNLLNHRISQDWQRVKNEPWRARGMWKLSLLSDCCPAGCRLWRWPPPQSQGLCSAGSHTLRTLWQTWKECWAPDSSHPGSCPRKNPASNLLHGANVRLNWSQDTLMWKTVFCYYVWVVCDQQVKRSVVANT